MEPGQSVEEFEQQTALDMYKTQLSQVEQAIQAAGSSEDLVKLKADLQELIKLTEDTLLDIKKARLLKMLGPMDDDEEDNTDDIKTTNDTIDDEYAAFQMAVGAHTSSSNTSTGMSGDIQRKTSKIKSASQDEDDSDSEEDSEGMDYQLSHLVGTKCRAPFSQDWGGLHYGNAMVLSIGDIKNAENADDCVVDVIPINPTHQSLVPCKYFMEDKCRFSAEECRSSHGVPVKISQLQPFLEPDYSKLKEGCRCLAKEEDDDVWYQAVVVEVCSDSQLQVQFDTTKTEERVLVEHVVPIPDEEDTNDSDSDLSDSNDYHHLNKTDGSDDESQLPVYLWKPAQTTVKLGAWETHTKGIGSKLMAKMGYVTGQGLGPRGDGRAEPVPILLLPAGKSLDKIMQLKEMSGDADLFNAMKRLEKRQKILEKKEAEKEKRGKVPQKWGMFGFLNQPLGDSADGNHPSSSSKHSNQSASSSTSSSSSSQVIHNAKQSSVKDLSKRSDSEVNVQIFKTAEAIRSVERNLTNLRRQLARNADKDRKMADHVREKILHEENSLKKLKNSSQTLEMHKERRKAHKKLTIF